MAREGIFESEYKVTDKVGMGKRGAEESDEDYIVGEDEESEDEDCSFAEEESEESFGGFEEEDDDEVVRKETKKAGRRTAQQSLRGAKKNGVVKRRKKKTYYDEEDDDYEEDDFVVAKKNKKRTPSYKDKDDDDIWVYAEEEDDDFCDGKPRRKTTHASSTEKYVECYNKEPRKKAKVSYREEMQDSEYEYPGDDNDNDVEFTPDEVDGVDEEEEVPISKKNKMDKLRVQETRITKGIKRKRNVQALKRTKKSKPTKRKASRRKGRFQNKDFADDNPTGCKRRKTNERMWGRRQSNSCSDSDLGSLGQPDYEYTMSEEEREQIREASEFCKDLATDLLSASSVKMIEEEESGLSQRKHEGKKGKDKVADLKIEVGKQVCGICLSTEGKRTIRGILNCCSHYFCFACIMEWSKVESRCPLCKQRFLTISRITRADGGHSLRDAVIQVPERDQVYQPTEEELRAYIDPYENVLCTECHQGGDDALMLLCDICDSPAHTYCVGLGHEVPEGNWYCDGCKPSALASNTQASNPTLTCGSNNNFPLGSSPVGSVREIFDLNELYIPETSLTQATGHSPSTRTSTGDFPDMPPASGSGVITVHDRRRIQRQIHQLLNDRARQLGRSDNVTPDLGVSLYGSQICRDGVALPLHTAPVPLPPHNMYLPGRLLNYTSTTPPWYHRGIHSPVLNSFRGQALPHEASTSTGRSFSGLSQTNIAGTNPSNTQGLGHQPLHPCNGVSNSGTDSTVFPYQFREVSRSSLEKAKVQSMVRSHLKSLSRNSGLGYITFKHIARISTHTILAACGFQHRSNEVHPVRTQPLMCNHSNRSANPNTSPIAGQCPSCFDWFVRNVVREILSTQTPL